MAYIDTIINRETADIQSKGFDVTVTLETVVASDNITIVHTGNSRYVLSRITPDANAVQGQDSDIAVYSPTASIDGKQMALADLGAGINKVFKEFVIVRKASTDYPTELTFVKITPIRPNF